MIAEQEIVARFPQTEQRKHAAQTALVIEMAIRVTIGLGMESSISRHIPEDLLPAPWGEGFFERYCEGIDQAIAVVPSGGIAVDVYRLRITPPPRAEDLGDSTRLGLAVKEITAGAVSALLAGLLWF